MITEHEIMVMQQMAIDDGYGDLLEKKPNILIPIPFSSNAIVVDYAEGTNDGFIGIGKATRTGYINSFRNVWFTGAMNLDGLFEDDAGNPVYLAVNSDHARIYFYFLNISISFRKFLKHNVEEFLWSLKNGVICSILYVLAVWFFCGEFNISSSIWFLIGWVLPQLVLWFFGGLVYKKD